MNYKIVALNKIKLYKIPLIYSGKRIFPISFQQKIILVKVS